MYKHYIRLDSNNFIKELYSDGFPNNYIDTDILIYQGDVRQPFLFDYVYNPILFDFEYIPNFKYLNRQILECTQEDKDIYRLGM